MVFPATVMGGRVERAWPGWRRRSFTRRFRRLATARAAPNAASAYLGSSERPQPPILARISRPQPPAIPVGVHVTADKWLF
jgi:hypothetical protein